ncbi:2'-5' RNA ligase [Cryobacterium sp. MP_M5]|uniref:2'-5' RNA ligase family protein n=1 Tax=unclassified Cryobacterium TaxID=2649013 RepID=UPI0018C94826|nr:MULTISPECIES: 2'-5' RNA ligase family protein [unclassified Cryobacterium]MBG6057228.1 2'-5' RNA ligase [Cryobacterium sp. MP_M3]MEC5175427.1 2'-5' RNA ligase [Cryobacterium sp. MP_M5]
MTRLVVVLPLVPLRTGDSFLVPDWPPHITVLPPFHTDAPAAEIADAIAAATAGQTVLSVTAAEDDLFGRRENIPVTLIAPNPALAGLHRTLVDAVRPLAAAPDEPAFTGPGFRAHVTVKRAGRVHQGDEFELTQIALVDMAPRSRPAGRAVLATLPLAPLRPPG